MTETIRSIADEYWDAKLEASPLFASFLGDHRYDDRADDLSAEEERRLRSVWVGLRERAAAIGGNGEFGETDRASPATSWSRSSTTPCAPSTYVSPS